jgi:hypothetical protein
MPTFGRDTIRKFCNNVSGMKKLAGRDFEDLLQVCGLNDSLELDIVVQLICLQCAIAAFEGLLDSKNNSIVMDLLFELATWHGLAKLRLHITSTLDGLGNSGTRLGIVIRKFASTTCEDFVTTELPSEEAARGRRKAAKAKKKGETDNSKSQNMRGKQRANSTGPVHQRKLNLSTYKLHALGDYPNAIRMFGTTDGISSQIVRPKILTHCSLIQSSNIGRARAPPVQTILPPCS